jgi:hypothetical protein
VMAPIGPSVDLFGHGSFWAVSVRDHTDDDIAYLINGSTPVVLTGDASHFAWAFKAGGAPRGWNKAGTTRGYVSLEQLRVFFQRLPEREARLRTQSTNVLSWPANGQPQSPVLVPSQVSEERWDSRCTVLEGTFWDWAKELKIQAHSS